MFVNTSKGICFDFFNNVANTCSYGLKILRNIDIKYPFHLWHIFVYFFLFHNGCLSAFNNTLVSITSMQVLLFFSLCVLSLS